MGQYQCKIVILILFLTLSCNQKTRNTTTVETATQSENKTLATDSLNLDLLALQKEGKLNGTTLITVDNDPVYHSTKRYEAVPLLHLLETHTAIKNLDAEKYQIVFECIDGYKPMMPLQKFLSVKSFLAVRDTDAPKGELWSKIIKDGNEMKAAPFYLVYQDVSAKETDLEWPYNLIKIHLVPNDENIAFLFPKENSKAELGYELFKKNCVTCHAINKIGGNMGPELNYPKSVTEYWNKKQLKAFILNPPSFRHGVKMPKPANLNSKDIDEIVYYLEYMANHKL